MKDHHELFVRIMRREPSPKPARQIIAEVAELANLRPEDITGPEKIRRYVIPRHYAMWRCCKETKLSTTQIGRIFGGRDHTTVLHGKNRWENHWSKEGSP